MPISLSLVSLLYCQQNRFTRMKWLYALQSRASAFASRRVLVLQPRLSMARSASLAAAIAEYADCQTFSGLSLSDSVTSFQAKSSSAKRSV